MVEYCLLRYAYLRPFALHWWPWHCRPLVSPVCGGRTQGPRPLLLHCNTAVLSAFPYYQLLVNQLKLTDKMVNTIFIPTYLALNQIQEELHIKCFSYIMFHVLQQSSVKTQDTLALNLSNLNMRIYFHCLSFGLISRGGEGEGIERQLCTPANT